MLVAEFCEELLCSCGINNLVAFPTSLHFGLDYKLPATSNIEFVTLGACPGEWNSRNCLLFTDNQKRITTWKEVK